MNKHPYRLCESYLSGAISQDRYDVLMRRLQKNTVALLAIEQLTGAVKAPPITLTSTGRAAAAKALSELRAEGEKLGDQVAALEEGIAKTSAEIKDGQLQRVKSQERNQLLFMLAARWPDDIRGLPKYHRPNWHYINYPFLAPGTDASITPTEAKSVNLLSAYATSLDQLTSTAFVISLGLADQRRLTLCFSRSTMQEVGDRFGISPRGISRLLPAESARLISSLKERRQATRRLKHAEYRASLREYVPIAVRQLLENDIPVRRRSIERQLAECGIKPRREDTRLIRELATQFLNSEELHS